MPGFMGIRGLDPPNPHTSERHRREDHKVFGRGEIERRSEEKVHEILSDQQGDMSAYTGGMCDASANRHFHAVHNLHVGEIMSARVAVLSFDDTLLTIQGIFAKVKFRHLPVVEDDGKIIGIISDRDYLRMESPFFGTVNEQTRDAEIMHRKAGTIMTRNPICAHVDTTLLNAVQLMNERKISCLPIIERGTSRLLGIVTWKDVVRAFCPDAFNRARDSSRLKSGVKINPQSAESARLRDKAAESARIRRATSVSVPPPPRPAPPPQQQQQRVPPSAPKPEGKSGVRTDTAYHPLPGSAAETAAAGGKQPEPNPVEQTKPVDNRQGE